MKSNNSKNMMEIGLFSERLKSSSCSSWTFPISKRFFIPCFGGSTVPHFVQRLKTFLFSIQFETKFIESRQDLTYLDSSIMDLEKSKMFAGDSLLDLIRLTPTPDILLQILAIGNHLNGGTNRGQAYGFKLENLLRLADTKTMDRKSSLLNYLAKKLGPEKVWFLTQINFPIVPSDLPSKWYT